MRAKTFLLLSLLTLAGSLANGALLFDESLDFGGVTDLWRETATANAVYSTTSIRHTYDATGLTHGQMTGESGGMYTYLFDGGTNSLGPNTITGAFDPDFDGIADAGVSYWLAALVRWGGGTSSLNLALTSNSSVNSLGFNVNSDGTISIVGSNDGNAPSAQNTGNQTTAGTTHLLLLRGTVGNAADGSGPTNSTLDFWFDPGDVFSLGEPDYTTGADSKFGRQNFVYTSVTLGGGSGNLANVPALDEIRFGTDLTEMFAPVPEPASFWLVGLAGLALVSRRRR